MGDEGLIKACFHGWKQTRILIISYTLEREKLWRCITLVMYFRVKDSYNVNKNINFLLTHFYFFRMITSLNLVDVHSTKQFIKTNSGAFTTR
jgi:hypothetical protein